MNDFFAELRRRKVYRVAVAYVVAAGGIIQLASAVFPAWELPSWTLRLVIVLLLIGFPIALLLSWAFDLTPSGIRPDSATTTTVVNSTVVRRRGNLVLLGGFGILVAAAAAFFLLPRASADKIDKSIAVLPFSNLSDDPENAFFADGIQDDVLTNLSKIGDLKVISRTSVMPYRGQKTSVRDIGKELGVGAILEGSVRRDKNNRVRVNVQLINARTDQHVWSEIYDRDLTDMFAIQSDLAQKIAEALQAKLSPTEKTQMTRRPTENGEAYFAFVQAHNLHAHVEDLPKLQQAEQLYARALQLDPKFALAAAEYSRLESWIYHSFEPTPARRDQARTLAQRALQTEPESPEGHLALGFSYYYGERDYERALQELSLAQTGLPNDPEVYLIMGAIERRQGKWNESNANLERAARLSPNETWPLQNLALNYGMLRDYPAANRTIDRALALDPKSLSVWGIKAQLETQEKGTFDLLDRGAESIAATSMSDDERAHFELTLAQTRLLARKFPEALQKAEALPDERITRDPEGLLWKYFVIGVAREVLGNPAGGREALLQSRGFAEKYVDAAPEDAARHGKLALVLAHLGEKERAIGEGKRAMELLPENADAFDGPTMTQLMGKVYATVGEPEKAIDLLEHLLARPASLSAAMLKTIPIWDPLRGNPRFEELLKKT